MITDRIFSRALPIVAAAGIGFAALPAQADQFYYTPPKLIKQGTAQTAVAGKGEVEVQVLVNSDGTFKVQRIVKSTNPADNKAALEIVNSSTYKPATRNTKPTPSFYTFKLQFTKGGTVGSTATGETQTASGSASGANAAGTAQYLAMIKAGNYSGAKSGLTSYVAAHPTDTAAFALLGVADDFLKDYRGAVDAFDKAGTVSANYKAAQVDAYDKATNDALDAKDAAAATTYAQKSIALNPNATAYYKLGLAQIIAQQYGPATTSLTKARELAETSKLDAKQRAVIANYMVLSAFESGQTAQGLSALKEALALDPASKIGPDAAVNYYFKTAQTQASSDPAAAATTLENAAQSLPTAAERLYVRAAGFLLSATKPDNTRAKADADKALALDPNDAQAGYLGGVALANQQQPKDALLYLTKADASAKAANNTELATRIEGVIKQLNGVK